VSSEKLENIVVSSCCSWRMPISQRSYVSSVNCVWAFQIPWSISDGTEVYLSWSSWNKHVWLIA